MKKVCDSSSTWLLNNDASSSILSSFVWSRSFAAGTAQQILVFQVILTQLPETACLSTIAAG
jgi:hypothetical protein